MRSKADFARIRKGKRLRVGCLRIVYRFNQLEHSRVGFAVSRKYGNAVQRNRLKRQLRSWFRISDYHNMAIDILIIPAVGANQMHSKQKPSVITDLMNAMSIIRRNLDH